MGEGEAEEEDEEEQEEEADSQTLTSSGASHLRPSCSSVWSRSLCSHLQDNKKWG